MVPPQMDIKIHRSLTKENQEEILIDAYKFSYLMIDAGEMKEAIFATVTTMLRTENGCFFSISEGDNKIAYGCFSYGRDDKKIRRLYYFAVHKEFRGRGIGKDALKLALESDVSLDHGCTVACQPELRGFYEKLGFQYYSTATDKKNEIIMVYFNPLKMDMKFCVEQIICRFQIEPNAFKLFNLMKKEMKKMKVKIPA